MKTKIGIIITLVLVAVGNPGCKPPDKVGPTQPTGCYDFPPLPQLNFGYTYIFSAITTGEIPYFNPANNSEIIYRRRDPLGVKLYTYNMTTKDSFCLGQDNFNSWPKWNKNGWLTMSGYDGQLCKLKSDGTQLTFLTKFKNNEHPDWSPDGGKIVFFATGGSGVLGLCIVNEDGSQPIILDSTKNADISSWSPDGTKIAYHESFYTDSLYNYITLIDVASKTRIRIASQPDGVAVRNISWFPNSKMLLYETQLGLYTLNIETHAVAQLKGNCNSRLYSFASVSADGKTILCEREDDTQDTKIKDNVHCTTHAILMNLDESNERIIDLK